MTREKLKDGRELILKSPEGEDGKEVLEVAREVMARSSHLLTTIDEFNFTVEQEEKFLRDNLKDPGKIVIVPVVDRKIVGMMNFTSGIRRRVSHQGEFGMSVLPEFQGLGIGDAMLKALLVWAKQNPKIETVRLRVHSNNIPAHHLYLKHGFVLEGREKNGVKLENGSYDDVLTMACD